MDNYYSLILGGIWLVFIVYWIVSAFSAKRSRGGLQRGLVFRILMILIVIILFGNNGVIPSLGIFGMPAFFMHPATKICGLILAAIGVAFAIWARTSIGRNWGMPMSLKENRELVMNGPYAYVRHPIYSGGILAFLGAILVNGPTWIPVFLLIFIYFTFSAVQEEKQLAKEFPEAYPAYKLKTKMLIPFVF